MGFNSGLKGLICLLNSTDDSDVCVHYEIIIVEVILLCMYEFSIIFFFSWPSVYSSRCKTVFLRLSLLTQVTMLFSHHSGLSYCSWHVWVFMPTFDIPIEPFRNARTLLSSSNSKSVVDWRLRHPRILSLYNKVEGRNVSLNISNVLQSLFVYDTGIIQCRFCSISYKAFSLDSPSS
jgi:hypothetical protein